MPVPRPVELNDLTEVAEGIYYSQQSLPVVSDRVIDFLKDAARSNARRRARFCAHSSPNTEQHDMLIVSHRETYVAPHRHLDKSETFVVLEGLADILLFDERGALQAAIRMGPSSSKLPFFYRMPPGQFHSLSIESEFLVFLESTKGPFRPSECENAAWAPDPEDVVNGRTFIASILGGMR